MAAAGVTTTTAGVASAAKCNGASLHHQSTSTPPCPEQLGEAFCAASGAISALETFYDGPWRPSSGAGDDAALSACGERCLFSASELLAGAESETFKRTQDIYYTTAAIEADAVAVAVAVTAAAASKFH